MSFVRRNCSNGVFTYLARKGKGKGRGREGWIADRARARGKNRSRSARQIDPIRTYIASRFSFTSARFRIYRFRMLDASFHVHRASFQPRPSDTIQANLISMAFRTGQTAVLALILDPDDISRKNTEYSDSPYSRM